MDQREKVVTVELGSRTIEVICTATDAGLEVEERPLVDLKETKVAIVGDGR
jgi:hypothetical protein